MSKMLSPSLFFIVCLFFPPSGFAQGKKTSETSDSPAPQPVIKKIGETTYRIGEIEFDAKTRVVSIPVIINMREGGPIEYLLVRETGKTHESILTTQASPMDLQIALKLLKYVPGEGDVFDKLLPAEDRKLRGNKSESRGSSVSFTVQWKQDNETKSASMNQWVLDGATIQNEGDPGESMADEPWHFTGSMISEGRFLAEMEGSIIAIYLDPVAIFNTIVPGSEMDERWGANHRLIPEIGTQGTLLIQPFPEK